MTDSKYLGHISVWANGAVTFEAYKYGSNALTVAELETAFKATVGAQAAAQSGSVNSESLTHLAASLLAKAGAAKARAAREAAEQAAAS